MYSLTGVEQYYGNRCVLRVPALTIPAGQTFAIIGPSGSGKSTLLRLLALLEKPTRGQVTLEWDGQTVHSESISLSERRRMAVMFQHPALLHRSVLENVAYGLRVRGMSGRAVVDRLLEQLALSHLAKSAAHTLSGGEMQRVALARALAFEPDILLLDEPAANLDPYHVRLIEQLLIAERGRRPLTVVIVTHNLFQAQRLADCVAVLLDGQLIEEKPTDSLFNAPDDPRTQAFLRGEYVY